jgi:hypothetical protein
MNDYYKDMPNIKYYIEYFFPIFSKDLYYIDDDEYVLIFEAD